MTEYDTLKQLVTEAEDDVQKAIGGNKAAGTRVRKKMQEIKSAASGSSQEDPRRPRKLSPAPLPPVTTTPRNELLIYEKRWIY